MAGVVESVGGEATDFKPGDEVFGMVGGVGGFQGTLAESVAADSALLVHKPDALTMEEAAALPLVAITAWEGLIDRANVHTGQNVLVHAGAGGVGYAAIQIARARGARVFTTVSEEKQPLVEALGATPILKGTPVEEYVAAHTGGLGFDVIYDTLGGPTLDASFLVAKRYTGHVVSWGSHSLAPLSFRGASYSGVFTLLPLLTGFGRRHHGEILREISALAKRGQMKPPLSKQQFGTYQIADAYDLVAAGNTGKVVVQLASNKR